MARKRIEWIDCVRCVGMVMIIVSHTYANGIWANILFAVNVPIFFVLSGYLTKRKKISVTMKRGIYTLIIPYLVTVIVMFLLSLISTQRHIHGMITTDHWYHYIIAGVYGIGLPTNHSIIPNANIPAIGAIWFLVAMYFANIIYQLLRKVSDYYSKIKASIILSALGTLITACGFWICHFVQLPWSIGAALISIIFYVAGYLIMIWNLMDINAKNTILSVIGLLLWIKSANTGLFWVNDGYASQPFINVIGAIGGSYFLMYLIKILDLKISMGFLAKLGELALITLSVHIICLNLFTDTNFISGKLTELGLSSVLIGIVIDIYRILFCWLVTLLLSKFKFLRKIYAIR
ncbi:MAG: acyltransferase family protein [Limosilactobacillus vaginalis]|uniref:acyltransferase family protein n=1 Tax=Limosilactobacillus vaginalis TaxID=1633 RepID=UPI003F01F117